MKISFSNEELTAYLDGELDADQTRRIEAAIREDAGLRIRLEQLKIDIPAVESGFAPILAAAESRDLARILQAASAANENGPTAQLARWRHVASYAAILIVGVAVGWMALPEKSDWRMEVAHYQALYVPETLAPVAADADGLAQQFLRASQALDLKLEPQDFQQISGLQLRRAQVLGYQGAPLVQIAFTLDDGTPIAFCILRASGDPGDHSTDTLVGLAATSWETSSHKFLAIGGADRSSIEELAQQLQQRL